MFNKASQTFLTKLSASHPFRRSFLQDLRIGGVVQSSRVHVPCGTTWYKSPTIDCLTLVRRFDPRETILLLDSNEAPGRRRVHCETTDFVPASGRDVGVQPKHSSSGAGSNSEKDS